MKKLLLLPIMTTILVLVTGCSNTSSKNSNTELTEKKYAEVVKNLKKELSSINDVSWDFKKSNSITNADISKGVMIEVFPKSEKDNSSLMDDYTNKDIGPNAKELQSKIKLLQKKVAKVARTLPNDNIEISLGFKSDQKSKGVIPIAESIKSMDAIPIH
ncbi:hypothetical protein OGZ51_10370 [Lactococcus lactis]|uniref:Lipoprotein n=1 Tax=Lactococcus lactis TaxID=1358 RepID=A0A9X4NJG6_9LACT|nr:hypothetical protein [Lactococcus lactis]MDG4984549.1 hypothetical protein [Lactococcus lactis]